MKKKPFHFASFATMSCLGIGPFAPATVDTPRKKIAIGTSLPDTGALVAT